MGKPGLGDQPRFAASLLARHDNDLPFGWREQESVEVEAARALDWSQHLGRGRGKRLAEAMARFIGPREIMLKDGTIGDPNGAKTEQRFAERGAQLGGANRKGGQPCQN